MVVEIPLVVSGDETIVRGIVHPHHFRSGKLHWAAFKPPPEKVDVSVIRNDYVGVEFCRKKAKSLEAGDKKYHGLAFLLTRDVRTAGPDVVDSRKEYLGHADIIHTQAAPPKGEPPDEFQEMMEACKALLKCAKFKEDPDPNLKAAWVG